jgi:hypothetical protein
MSDPTDPLSTLTKAAELAARYSGGSWPSAIECLHFELAANPDAVRSWKAALDAALRELAEVRASKDGAYLERNRLVQLLASLYPSGIRQTSIEGWSDDWHGCVYIDLPTGQASWHYHDSHAYLFAHLPPYTKPWDGHTTEQKYDRVSRLAYRLSTPSGTESNG